MNFALHGREIKSKDIHFVQQIIDELSQNEIIYTVSGPFAKVLKECEIRFSSENIFFSQKELKNIDCFLSLGGDGTFLESLSYVGINEIPILGINFGRLGFLTSVQPENISETIQKLKSGHFSIDQRSMLNASSTDQLFEEDTNFALNEIALTKNDSSSMIVVHAYVDNIFVNSYWADGLMISTPTGSTGYNLSCGGPLIMPHADNFIITPICPHNLFVRPMVVSSSSKISLRVESRSNKFLLSMDSRSKIMDKMESEIIVTKEKFNAKLVIFEGEDFLNTLRVKLGWGKDLRNPFDKEK